MNTGVRVLGADRKDGLAGTTEQATVVSLWTRQRPPLEPMQMVCVRYDDGEIGDVPADAVTPI